MKRKISILLVALMLALSVVACNKAEQKPAEAPAEKTEAPAEKPAEKPEEKPAEKPEEKPAETATGEIAKIGLGSVTSTTSSSDKTDDKAAKAQADVVIAAIAFDADGKIVKAELDAAQTKTNFTEDYKSAEKENIDVRTKVEKGDDYDMRKASPIKKEYNEQIEFFEDYIVGMTAEEVMSIPTKAKDDHHQNVPDVPELLAGTTIDIKDQMEVVGKAWENAKDAAGATKLALAVETSPQIKDAADGKNASVQFNTTMVAVAFDDDGKIVQTIYDAVQPKIEVAEDGKIVAKEESVPTKKEKGDAYDMRKASAIGKEWNEQALAFEEYTIGKTADDIVNMPTKPLNDAHPTTPDVPELASSCTMDVGTFLSLMVKANTTAE